MKNNVAHLSDYRARRYDEPVSYQINPWPLAIGLSLALWGGIGYVAWLVHWLVR